MQNHLSSSSRTSKSRGPRTRRAVERAYRDAAGLGPLAPVEPTSRRIDGFPELGRDQVYVFQSGKAYHPIACDTVMGAWDSAPESVLVIVSSTTGTRRRCGTCAETTV